MPMEIEARRPVRRPVSRRVRDLPTALQGYTSTDTQTFHMPLGGLGTVRQLPRGKVLGIKSGLVGMTKGRPPTKSELESVLIPVAREHQFEVLSTKYLIDDNPVWTWKVDPDDKNLYEAVIASGPFAGKTGDVLALNDGEKPSLNDTMQQPRAVFSWVMVLRPRGMETSEVKVGVMRQAVRDALTPFRNMGSSFVTSTKTVEVEAQDAKQQKKLGATAAFVGIALTLLSIGVNR